MRSELFINVPLLFIDKDHDRAGTKDLGEKIYTTRSNAI